VAAGLPGEIPSRHPAQFVVNQRHQGISGRNFAVIPANEQFGDVMTRILIAHVSPKHYAALRLLGKEPIPDLVLSQQRKDGSKLPHSLELGGSVPVCLACGRIFEIVMSQFFTFFRFNKQ
jgi:hypothetical protein